MSDPLYKKELLRLAADAAGAGRLAAPAATGVAHNPACGDKVTIDLAIMDERIAGIAHETRACVLTQASAAVLGCDVVGLTRAEIVVLHQSVAAMLTEGAAPPGAPFDTFAVFEGVAEHHGRHRCVLLPLEAILAAFDASDTSEPGGEGAER
jgi:NifU-like protein involved in Fe-S cluster formation